MPPDPTHNIDPITECCTRCGCLAYVAIALKPCVKAVPAVEVDWFATLREFAA